VFAATPGVTRAANAFPAGHEGYHNYSEMSAFLDDVVTAHPGIAQKFSLGRSYQGREIWALKISDNVATDENEPEVLFMSMEHAREWLSIEQDLRIITLLTDNYTSNPATQLEQRVRDIVDGLEIYVVPMVNPDGAEYDISNPDLGFRNWRKNRQPVGAGVQPGIDLNRNYGFMWGCCGGSTAKPGSTYYRGSQPWQAVETSLVRDFVLGRVVGGVQQIRAAIDWHSFNEQIMWPFGYTTADQPRPMAADDLAAFRAVSREMAQRNGYTAMQMSDLYVMDGDSIDWLYGDQRIFALTIEVYPQNHTRVGRFHPPDDVIERETTRNDQAVLYFLEQVRCPYDAAGLGATRCGPLDDDFETGRGWQVDPFGSDTATAGAWQRAIPQKSANGTGVKQRAYGYSARYALVTGAARGASATANDLDGLSSVRSLPFKLGSPGSTGWTLGLRYTFAHDASSSAADFLRVSVGGTVVWSQAGAATNRNAAWTPVSVNLDAFAGQTVRVLVEACDCANDSLVEAAIDDVRVYQVP
jgi:hypothetical protein